MRIAITAERGRLRLPRGVAFLGVAHLDDQMTQLSRTFMVGPLADLIENSKPGEGWKVQCDGDGDATRRDAPGPGADPRRHGGTRAALYRQSRHGFQLDDPRQCRHLGVLLPGLPRTRAWKQPIRQGCYFSADPCAATPTCSA